MKEDKLKSFIDDNREGFDEFEPSSNLWSSIEGQLDEDNKVVSIQSKTKWYWTAAAAIFLLLMGAGIQYLIDNTNNNNSAVAEVETQEISLGFFSEELAEVENYYISEINYRKDQVRNIEGGELLLKDIEDLQKDYQELSEELKDQTNSELIIEAMIENYRLRLSLLERMLQELKNENKTEEDEFFEL